MMKLGKFDYMKVAARGDGISEGALTSGEKFPAVGC